MISIVLGTRPEIIKMSPLIRACEEKSIEYSVIHTGQHYSYELDKIFFDELELPKPNHNLDVGSGTHAEETGRILMGVEKILVDEKPDVVLVEGDTNTVLAGALAATKLHIMVGHIEAGLRSYFREMPEEINRILVDHMSDYLFAPTENAKKILMGEGIPEDKIFVTGNTIVDAVHQNLEIAERKSTILSELNLKRNEYLLVTAHRAENVDNKEKLLGMLEGLEMISEHYSPIIYPIHPRTRKRIKEFKLGDRIKSIEGLKLIDPVGFLDFLLLECNAKLVLTDSGGVQEESCILQVPCVTLRENTERPETLEVGSNVLAGTDSKKIIDCAKEMISKERNWRNPFGDGESSERILDIVA